MKILPIHKFPSGKWSVGIDNIRQLWSLMSVEEKTSIVFPASDVQGELDFLILMTKKSTYPLIILKDDEPILLIWMNGFNGFGMGYIHFCTFTNNDEFSYQDKVEAGIRAVEVFSRRPNLKVIVGQIPAKNKKAIRYGTDCGFKVGGTIPSLLATTNPDVRNDAVLMYKEIT